MPGVPRRLIEHSLNVDPKATPKRQHLRRFAQDRREAIKKELAKLLATGFIREVFHPQWLANPDEDITPLDAHDDPPLNFQGPITRARARQINLQVSSFLCMSLYNSENRLLPNDYIMLRNNGEDQGMHRRGFSDTENQRGRSSQDGVTNQVDFESVSESRTSKK